MSDIIISTRVRLARNLKDYPFPCKLSEQGKQKVSENVRAAITQSNSALQDDFEFIELDSLSPTQGVSLVEKRLVSPEFISDTTGRALLLSKQGLTSSTPCSMRIWSSRLTKSSATLPSARQTSARV